MPVIWRDKNTSSNITPSPFYSYLWRVLSVVVVFLLYILLHKVCVYTPYTLSESQGVQIAAQGALLLLFLGGLMDIINE